MPLLVRVKGSHGRPLQNGDVVLLQAWHSLLRDETSTVLDFGIHKLARLKECQTIYLGRLTPLTSLQIVCGKVRL
jgi:hypothetical protein